MPVSIDVVVAIEVDFTPSDERLAEYAQNDGHDVDEDTVGSLPEDLLLKYARQIFGNEGLDDIENLGACNNGDGGEVSWGTPWIHRYVA